MAQRVSRAEVRVAGEVRGAIAHGLCLLACAVEDDEDRAVHWLADKIVDLRMFADAEDRTNLSLLDTAGAALVVPQFTLAADWRKGRRPSFTRSAEPGRAKALVATLCARLVERGVSVEQGVFGDTMSVSLTNDGPFTLVLDSALAPG